VKKKKILILGSQGFLGSHLVQHFLHLGCQVTGCDLTEAGKTDFEYYKISLLSTDVEDLFGGNTYDVCINAAGSGNVSYSLSHPLSDFEANALSVIHILEAIRKFNGSCRYLHISSAAVYGNPATLPVMETHPCQPISPYGYHKHISEMICREYHTVYGIQVAVIRPFSVYGPGQRKQLLWDMCRKLQASDSITLFGTGKESRDFIHIQDVARLMQCIIEADAFAGNVFNAASGTETTIQQIADWFTSCYEGNKKIRFSGEVRPGDPLNWCSDISRIRSVGYAPSVLLKDGIEQYIRWFAEHA